MSSYFEEKIKITESDRLPYAVACINSEYIEGFSCVASMMGAEKIIIFGWDRSNDPHDIQSYKHYIPIEKIYNDYDSVVSKSTFYETMTKLKYFPVFIEQDGNKDIQQISEIIEITKNMKLKPCLIFGGSGHGTKWSNKGIPPVLMRGSNFIYTIPQLGAFKSLQLVAASSIAMWELRKAYIL